METEKRKPGRPRDPNRLGIGIRVGLRDDERDLIRTVAEAKGMSMSSYVRSTLLRAANRAAKASCGDAA